MKSILSHSLLLALVCYATALPHSSNPSALVKLDYGSFQGQSSNGLVEFLGMPFAQPPVGDLRFALPKEPKPFEGIRNATSYGAACPQQALTIPPGSSFQPPNPPVISEDCLFINVVKPANVTTRKPLPVVMYIFGGGFQFGDTSDYDPSVLLNRSVSLNEPVIYVSANYRLTAFGFLGGKEVQAAGIGNAGLQDQQLAMRWVQKYISKFGGDPNKVTIWGLSAGAISVSMHMILNDGQTRGLFHQAVMQSGAPMHIPKITDQQPYFDKIVQATNCATAQDAIDCLRKVPYDNLLAAINTTPNLFSPQSLRLAYTPMIDGRLIKRAPLLSVKQGKYARIPVITGNVEDEGTFFAIMSTTNIVTDQQFLDFIKTNFFPHISPAGLAALATAYPQDPTQGSPFNSGNNNTVTPQFKRIAAILGDIAFQAPRRFFTNATSGTQPSYAYRYRRGVRIPTLGVFHTSDQQLFFGLTPNSSFVGPDAIINFAYTGNPNAKNENNWQLWSKVSPPEFTFIDPAPAVNVTVGDYRKDQMQLIIDLLMNEADS
ncbi:carotenoid ester lipase precursor [Panaeolus papilionaceus]|nr:carotenoid ester lipase precursor [Panaeolus papilionaceus]